MATQPRTHALELKVPPLALVVLAALLMWLGAVYFPELTFRFPFQILVVWLISFLGFLACTLGFVEFRRARTTLNPTKPGTSSSLVKTGIYRYSRNPMYLGFLLILTGWATGMGNVISFLALPVFVIYLNRFQIEPEERALGEIFADEFRAYCAEVRRWI